MRNPFRLRAAQRAVSDEEFVQLFGAGVLELIEDVRDPWGGLVFLRSAPGGGKTSFLRMLTPRSLNLVWTLRDHDNVRPTFDALRQLGAVSERGPEVFGVFCAFTNEYRELEAIDHGGAMFRALLNARIVVATIRGLLERSDRSYPDDLPSIKASWTPDVDTTIPRIANGAALLAWASAVETQFYEQLDALGEVEQKRGGHTRLDALQWLATAEFRDANGSVNARRAMLLDDLQFLTTQQRETLKSTLIQSRSNCAVWVAERMEALSHQELLGEGALPHRDYEAVIHLENAWSGRPTRYAKFVGQIADLRARRADSFSDRDFFSLIADSDDVSTWGERFLTASSKIQRRVEGMTENNTRYDLWVRNAGQAERDPFRDAAHWRLTQILVHRELSRSQQVFDFDELTLDMFRAKASTSVEQAAELFLRHEIKAPMYFGKSTIAAVSSTNVDQYVEIAGDLFEEISASIGGPRTRPTTLTADRQHALIKAAAERRWTDIPRRLPEGYDAQRLLEAAGAYCQQQTYRPTAPYAPGVTGFAIAMHDRARLIRHPPTPPALAPLRDCLSSLVSHNLLTPRIDVRSKGRSFIVFYLNRLLCAHFDLPLGYGGWRERSLSELCGWLREGAPAVEEHKLV